MADSCEAFRRKGHIGSIPLYSGKLRCHPVRFSSRLGQPQSGFRQVKQGYGAASLLGQIQTRPASSCTNIQQIVRGHQAQMLNHHDGLIACRPAVADIAAIADFVRYGLKNRRLCITEFLVETGCLFFFRQASCHQITCILIVHREFSHWVLKLNATEKLLHDSRSKGQQ